MRHFVLVLAATAVFACKPRDPDAGGLLSDEPAAEEEIKVEIAKGGDWIIACKPADADGGSWTYDLAIEGAVSNDEAQSLLVSVSKSQNGKTQNLVTKELGHGAVSAAGPLFVGFASGVLTGDPGATEGNVAHNGVLTLVKDAAEGVKVVCRVAKA